MEHKIHFVVCIRLTQQESTAEMHCLIQTKNSASPVTARLAEISFLKCLSRIEGGTLTNTIQQELELAKSKQLQTVDYKNGKRLVCLTRDNIAIVEAMNQNDSAYRRSTKADAEPVYKKNKPEELIYGGSSGYWLTRLKRILLEK